MPVPDTSRAPLTRARWLFHTLIQDDLVASRVVRTSAPAPAPERARNGQTSRAAVLAGLALVTLLAAIGVLLAPVVADDPMVSWPQAGLQPRSTVLPLVPYRPLSLDARVPCTALSALDQRPEGGDALRTLPASAGQTGTLSQGLVVTVHGGLLRVSASGRSLVQERLPAGGCTYRVLADAGGVRVLRDGVVRGAAPMQLPEVSELSTDLDGQDAAAGLAVSLHPDARYESTPTTLKISLLLVCAAALLTLLGLAWRWWGGRPVPIRRPRPRVADAVLTVVSGAWVLLAPTNFDDSWYALMARGAASSGSVGNAIYMFNATESPFVASQYVLQAWGSLGGWGLAWLRLVPLIYGLVTWLLLRLLLANGFGPELETPRATWALLVAYLLWWLPYGMTLRPEPLIVLLAAATLLLAELARRRRSVGALAAATATAVLAMTVSPSGLVAAAPLVLALPWLWAWWRAQPTAGRVAAVLLLAATGASLVLVGFADATLGDVLEATAVHQWYYHAFPWYQEYIHYQTILSFKDSSQWARRAPVVLTIAVLVLVAMARRTGAGRPGTGSDDPLRRLLLGSAACSALALALLAPTPTKFVNHFGAAAAAPTMLLAAALLRSPLHLSARRLTVLGTALLIGAVSWSFAGPNIWRPYSDRGQPFGNHLSLAQDRVDLVSVRPKLGPISLANPLLWVLVALIAVWLWRRRGSALAPDRAVLVTGSTAIVAVTLIVFVWAPLRQYPGWTVASAMLRAAQGEPCALADHAQVLVDTVHPNTALPNTVLPDTVLPDTVLPDTVLPNTAAQPVPAGPTSRYGAFAAAAGRPSPVPLPAPGTLVWHDIVAPGVGSDLETHPDTGRLTKPGGLLVTSWFTLPAQGGSTLLVPVLGARTGQKMTMEYATAAGPDPAVAGSMALTVDRTTPQTEWQQASVDLDRLGAGRPSSVRLIIHEPVSSADNRLAVDQPRLAGWQPLTALTAGAPVYVDQLTATLLPCLNQVGVEHGIARAPQLLVLSDEGFGRGFLDLGFEVARGGTQVPVGRSATTVRIPTRLVPSGPPSLPWGRVERVIYDHPVGLVDRHVDQQRRAGWTRLPTLAATSYHDDHG